MPLDPSIPLRTRTLDIDLSPLERLVDRQTQKQQFQQTQQAQQQKLKQQKQQQFQKDVDASSVKSLVDADQALSGGLTPQNIAAARQIAVERRAFLQSGVDQGFQLRGGTRETEEFIRLLDTDPAQAQALISSGITSLERQGLIKAPAAAATKAVIDTQTGQDTFATNEQLQADPGRFRPRPQRAATEVSVTLPGEKTERQELGKVRARQFERVLTAAENAESTLESLDQLDALDVETGALEPSKAAFAAVVEGLGIDASSIADVGTTQAFKAVSNRLINNVLNLAKGPQTEGDAKRARTTIANLGDSPFAAQFKTDSLRAVALRQIEQADFVESFLENADPKDQIFTKARKAWNRFKKKTPSLSSAVKNPTTGVPVFFYQFKQQAQQKRPGITDEQIINAWRGAHNG